MVQDLATSSMVQAQALTSQLFGASTRSRCTCVHSMWLTTLHNHNSKISWCKNTESRVNARRVCSVYLSHELYCAFAYSDGVSHIGSACRWTFLLAFHKHCNAATTYKVRTLLTNSTESPSFTRTYFTPGNHNFWKASMACPIFELNIITHTASRYRRRGDPGISPLKIAKYYTNTYCRVWSSLPQTECGTVDFGCMRVLVHGSMWEATNLTQIYAS